MGISPVQVLLRDCSPGHALVARLQLDASGPVTGFIIREDAQHLARLPAEPQIQVRAGALPDRDVLACAVLAQVGGAGCLYETWLNYHNPAHRLCLEDLARQTTLPFCFYVDREEPARTIHLPENPLSGFATQILGQIAAVRPWGMEQFDSAKKKAQSGHLTARALWEALGSEIATPTDAVIEQPVGQPVAAPSSPPREPVSARAPETVTERPGPKPSLTPASVVPCPQCGNEIPDFAIACPYCGAYIRTIRSGYCPQCRAVVGVTAATACQRCGGETKDVRVEHVVAPEAIAQAVPMVPAPVVPAPVATRSTIQAGGTMGIGEQKKSWWGRRRKGTKLALVFAGIIVLAALVGGLTPLIREALQPSDAELVQTLTTTTDAADRQKAAADLATRHSPQATRDLAEAAATDATAREGLAALRDAYIACFGNEMDSETLKKSEGALKETAQCLGLIGDATSIEALGGLSCTSECDLVSVRVAAVGALAETESSGALPHLIEALALPSSIDPTGEIGDVASVALPAFPNAVMALILARTKSTGDESACSAIDETLAKIGEPAVEPLVAQFYLTDWSEKVLTEIGTAAIPAVSQELASGQRVVRHRALGVLLRLCDRDEAALTPHLVKTDLLPLLIEARFIAHYGDERDTAAEAVLAAIGGPAVDALVGLLGATDWAERVLVEIGPVAVPAVARQLGRDEAPVRYQALGVLLQLYETDRDAVAPELVRADRVQLLIEARNEAGYGDERDATIASVLTEIGGPAAEALVAVLPQTFWAGGVLAGMGETAVPALQSALKSKDSDTRFAAADVLVQMQQSDPASVVAFTSALSDEDLKFVATNYAFYIRLGQAGTEAILDHALQSHGNKQMCLDYLNCGNDVLRAAAEEWAADNGYTVTWTPGVHSGPQWGEGN